MDGFLTGVRAQNTNRGRKTLFYVRDYSGHSHVVERDVDDYYVSQRISFNQAVELEAALKKFGSKIFESGSMYVVVVYGPRELKRDREFKDATKVYRMDSEPQRSLELRYPPLTRVNAQRSKVTPEQLLNDTYCGLDIELVGMETETPLPYIVALPNSKENIIFTTNETNVRFVQIDDDKVRIERVGSVRELVEYSERFIQELDPLWIDGQNIMDFDIPHMRLHGDFRIGVGGTKPIIQGGISGFHSFRAGKEKTKSDKVVVDGRYVIDTLIWARNNLWLPDNKLETITGHYDMGFEKAFKDIDWDAMGIKSRDDPELALEIAVYCFKDARITTRTASIFRPEIVREAIDFDTDPTTVCYKSVVATKYYDQRTFNQLRILRKRRDVGIDVNKKKLELLGLVA